MRPPVTASKSRSALTAMGLLAVPAQGRPRPQRPAAAGRGHRQLPHPSGASRASIGDQIQTIIADPSVTVDLLDTGVVAAPASPLRDDVVSAVTAAVHARYPGLTVTPSMAAGATDSMHFRAQGVPSYGVSTIFMKPEDDVSHGLNERLPLDTIAPGIAQWEAVLRTMAD
nr:M20/M25/M40 family metallo-hydrolase [Brevundimonas naejangsanensis]